MQGCMRKCRLITLCAVLLALLPGFASADYVPGKVIVRFQQGIVLRPGGRHAAPLGRASFSQADLADSLDALGITGMQNLGRTWRNVGPRSGTLDFSGVFLLDCPYTTDIPALVERLKSLSGVADAEPSYTMKLFWTPNDPLYGDQWHLTNTGQPDTSKGLPDVDIDADAAWDSVYGSNVPVYVIDTGVGMHHEDLPSVSWVNNIAGGPDEDEHGHGTAVAGIIAAKCNNNTGVTGINCYPSGGPIKAIKVTRENEPFPDSYVVEAFEDAADDGARIVNCSFGNCDFSFTVAAATRDLYLSGDYGVLISCASGNWDPLCKGYPRYPAAYANTAYGVSALIKGGRLWWDTVGGTYVDVSAPGGCEITTTYCREEGYPPWYDCDYMSTFGGTSAAAPMVSGVAAVLLGVVDSLTNDDLAYIIRRTATDVEPWGWDGGFGWGKVNTHRAVRFISGPDREFLQGCVDRQDVSIGDSSATLYEKTFKNLEWCFGDTTLPDAQTVYLVRRYRTEATVTFGYPYLDDIANLWVRHKSGISPGWPDESTLDGVLHVGWGEADTTGWSSMLAEVYSFTYALYETSDTSFVGYFPIHPDSVDIPYSAVLGSFDEAPYVEVMSPNGGEQWGCLPSGTRTIEWEASDDDSIHSIDIYWSIDNGYTWPYALTTGQTNDSAYTWAVAGEDTCSGYSRIAIVAHDGRLDCNCDMSDGKFKAGGLHKEIGQWGPPMRPRTPTAHPACMVETGATVYFSVPKPIAVSLKIYDVRGRLVRPLIDSETREGTHRVTWDLTNSNGNRVPEGVYFYRFTAGRFADTGKLVVLAR
jgi:hypothetical protein